MEEQVKIKRLEQALSAADHLTAPPQLDRFQPLAETLRHCALLSSEEGPLEPDEGAARKSFPLKKKPSVGGQLHFRTAQISFQYLAEDEPSSSEEPPATAEVFASGTTDEARAALRGAFIKHADPMSGEMPVGAVRAYTPEPQKKKLCTLNSYLCNIVLH